MPSISSKSFLIKSALSCLALSVIAASGAHGEPSPVTAEAAATAPSAGKELDDGTPIADFKMSSLQGKSLALLQIKAVQTVGVDGTVYKGSCSPSQVAQAFSFNAQQVDDAVSTPILTSKPELCSRLDFNSVMFFPATPSDKSGAAANVAAAGSEDTSAGQSPDRIVLAWVEGHPASSLLGSKSTLHVVHGVKLNAKCEASSRPKMLGLMSETILNCEILDGGEGRLSFIVE